MVDYESLLRKKFQKKQEEKFPIKKFLLTGLAWLAVLFLLFILFLIGWAIYFNTQFTVYHDAQYNFSIDYYKTWQVIVHPKKNVAVEFIRPKDTALDTIQENFNVTVQPLPPGVFSLDEFSGMLKAQMISVFGKKIIEYRPFHWGWRQGYWMSLAVPKPDNYRLVNVWLVANNQAYIMTFLGSINKYPHDYIVIHRMVRSFRLLQ